MAPTREVTGIDLETYSGVNLKTEGLDRYVNSPDFTILLCSLSYSDGHEQTYDLVFDEKAGKKLAKTLATLENVGQLFAAHNVGFERASLKAGGIPAFVLADFMDSAVIARTQGAASSLANASRQLLPSTHKLDTGTELIQLFCVPNEWNGGKPPTRELIESDPVIKQKWEDFIAYCEVDARASREIVEAFHPDENPAMLREIIRELLTAKMNERGWPVDMSLVKHMQVRYKENVQAAKANFRAAYDPTGELNFASPVQLKEWCKARGVRASGFDQEKVDVLADKLRTKLMTMTEDDPKYQGYYEVWEMLKTKQIIGGSSLTKLQTILNTVGPDNRLRNQYLHCGAGQTYRTSGRGVQMQNLKRLGNDLLDMDQVYEESVELSNDVLGANLRQVFTASHPQGRLIVGDFSSVESRGLAWLAGADWKIEAYRQGKDMYKVLAAKLYGIRYEDVTKDQRKMGKLGELSCGYGAGKVAVGRMAGRQGLDLDETQSQEVVTGWRETNPEVTELWDKLGDALKQVVAGSPDVLVPLANGLWLEMSYTETPASLLDIHPNARSVKMAVYSNPQKREWDLLFERVFHGCYLRGMNVAYYKPTERKTGALWSSHFVDPATKQVRFFELYGGKLAGILTQSFCRELFFDCVQNLEREMHYVDNAEIIGQFHDEIVVDWRPPAWTMGKSPKATEVGLDATEALIGRVMQQVAPAYQGFPMAADIKYDRRYIK